ATGDLDLLLAEPGNSLQGRQGPEQSGHRLARGPAGAIARGPPGSPRSRRRHTSSPGEDPGDRDSEPGRVLARPCPSFICDARAPPRGHPHDRRSGNPDPRPVPRPSRPELSGSGPMREAARWPAVPAPSILDDIELRPKTPGSPSRPLPHREEGSARGGPAASPDIGPKSYTGWA